ncbi:MAG: HAD family hydrolase [Planctomycetota bacterium]
MKLLKPVTHKPVSKRGLWPASEKIRSVRTLLFDIDGTLLTTAGGGNRAFARALECEFGVPAADVAISFSGRTDRSLLGELLQRNNLPFTDTECGRLRRAYLRHFEQELGRTGGTVLPGVAALFSRLAGHDEINLAVMTGNFPESATRKLEHFNLRSHVQWIVGGDLDEDRDDMARRAALQIERRHGTEGLADMIVIGDTPADIQCGHAIGARVLAVATGTHTIDQLAKHDPWQIADDLSDTGRIVELLTS